MLSVGVGEMSENSHKLTGGVYYFRLPFFYALSRVLEKFSRVIPTYPFSISKKFLRELSGAYMLFYSYTCSISLFKAFIFLCNSFYSLTYLNWFYAIKSRFYSYRTALIILLPFEIPITFDFPKANTYLMPCTRNSICHSRKRLVKLSIFSSVFLLFPLISDFHLCSKSGYSIGFSCIHTLSNPHPKSRGKLFSQIRSIGKSPLSRFSYVSAAIRMGGGLYTNARYNLP